ncbi:hypothetical protein PLESTM_000098000 [Pleodorina starrii]|nr:hypothetical protein PLESTM_000098000 [Pleodorina starrii]
MDDTELLFLIWRSLSSGPLAGAARALEEEATRQGLLPSRVDIAGNVHQLSFEQHARVYSHVPPDALQRLLQKLLQKGREANAEGGAQVVSLTAPGKHGLLGCEEPPLPRWLRRPHAQACLPHQLLLRQSGLAPARVGMPGSAHRCAAMGALCRQMRHLTTVRGHRLAVYCCTYDNSGRRIITGSDDYLVKIWSAETGVLLKSCRGHDAEVTDFAVSRDNAMLASGDVAHTIRVWSLQEGTLGWPVSVLSGHTNVVSYLDFHPHLTEALLSCSTDGTARVWNARDPGVGPIVMRPGADFGAGDGGAAEAAEAVEGLGAEGAYAVRGDAAEAGAAGDGGDGGGVDLGSLPGSSRAGAAALGSGGRNGAGAGGLLGSPPPAQQQEEAAAPPPADPNRPPVGFLCCSWSPDGAFIFAGGSDCTVCVWHWDLTVPPPPPQQQQPLQQPAAALAAAAAAAGEPAQARGQQQQQLPAGGALAGSGGEEAAAGGPQSEAEAGRQAAVGPLEAQAGARAAGEGLSALWEGREWPRPTELAKLSGHRNDIVFIEFSHEGTSVATASRDGCVKVAWNRDDSRMVAAVTDNSVRVWDTGSGEATHILLEHTAQAHVLEAHPQDPRLVMSGGYDGRTILWDVVAGTALRMFSTQDTFPGRGRWTDPLQLVDGHFSPDGSQLAVTDTAGQLHLYGSPCTAAVEAMARAPYDQFLGSDYNGLVRDVNGWVLDELTQQPPHLMATGQVLCDYSNHPYPIDIQAAFAVRRLSDLPRPHPVDRDHPLPAALLSHPPTLVSASWLAIENGSSNAAVQLAMNRAYERHMQALEALARPDVGPTHLQQHQQQQHRGGRRTSGARSAAAAAAAAATVAGSRHGSEPPAGARRPLSGAAAASASAAAAAAAVPRGVYLVVDDPTAPPPPPLLMAVYDTDSSDGRRRRHREPSSSSSSSSDGDDDDDVVSISDPGSDDDDDDDDDDAVVLVDSDDGRPVSDRGRRRGGREGRGGPAERGRGGGGGAAAAAAGGSAAAGGGGGDDGGRSLRRSSRRERAEAREEGQQERQVRDVDTGIRRSARLSGHKRRYGEGEDAPESYDSEDEMYDAQLQDDVYDDSGAEEEAAAYDDDDDSGDDDEARRRQRRAASRRQRERERERERRAAARAQRELRNQQRREQRREERRRRQQQQQHQQLIGGDDDDDPLIGPHSAGGASGAFAMAEVDAAAAGGGGGVGVLSQVARRRSHEAGGSRPRPLEAYSWLQCTSYLPDFYCPQLGDEVVYVRAGHEAYLDTVGDKRAGRPWWQLPGMRPCEPCIVTELGYEILRDGAFRTAANLQLQVDPSSDSPVAGRVFSLQLPPPAPDQPAEFLVPLHRFTRAVTRRWRIGERCKTYHQLSEGDVEGEGAGAGGGGGGGGGGRWYGATVVSDRLYPELTSSSGEPPPLRQPYEVEGLWERYSVVWDGEAEATYLSPWAMLPMTSSWDDVVRYARATAAAKADEIVAAAASAAASAGGSAAGPSTSSYTGGGGGGGAAAAVSELHLGLGGGWAEEQASAARLALERLFAEERLYGMFVHCPPPTASYPCADGDARPVPYNAIVPLPMSLELIEQRLDNSFYRSLAAVLHDLDTLVSNAERFNGADSALSQRAREMRLHFTAALTGRCVDHMLLLGPQVDVKRRSRTAAAPRRRRADLSRLWELVALDLDLDPNAAAAAGPGRRGGGGGGGRGRYTGADAIRGGPEAAGGVTGPRRRGGVWVPLSSPPPPPSQGPGSGGGGVTELAAGGAVAGLPWDAGAADGSGSALDARGRFAPSSRNPSASGAGQQQQQQPQRRQLQRHRGSQRDSDYEAEEDEEAAAATAGRLKSPPGRGSRRQQQQQPQVASRPRRERALVPGRFAKLYGGSEDDDDEDYGEAAADSSDPDVHMGGREDSDSDSDGRGRRRRRQQQQQQRGQGRRTRQQQQQQPLRRSARARQRTKYGSDWEDEQGDQEDEEVSDDSGGGARGGRDSGGGSGRRTASADRRRGGRAAAAVTATTTADEDAMAVNAGAAAAAAGAAGFHLGGSGGGAAAAAAEPQQGTAWPSLTAAELSGGGGAAAAAAFPPPAAMHAGGGSTLPWMAAAPIQQAPGPVAGAAGGPAEGVTAAGEGGPTAAAAAVRSGDAAAGEADLARGAQGPGGRLKIRLRPVSAAERSRTAAAAPQLPPLGVLPPFPTRSQPQSYGSVGGVVGGGGVAEGAVGRQELGRPQRGPAAAAAAAAPPPPRPPPAAEGGRSRRAAAVAAVAAAAAAAAAAARSDESEQDGSDDGDGDGDGAVGRGGAGRLAPPLRRPAQRIRGRADAAEAANGLGIANGADALAAWSQDGDGGGGGGHAYNAAAHQQWLSSSSAAVPPAMAMLVQQQQQQQQQQQLQQLAGPGGNAAQYLLGGQQAEFWGEPGASAAADLGLPYKAAAAVSEHPGGGATSRQRAAAALGMPPPPPLPEVQRHQHQHQQPQPQQRHADADVLLRAWRKGRDSGDGGAAQNASGLTAAPDAGPMADTVAAAVWPNMRPPGGGGGSGGGARAADGRRGGGGGGVEWDAALAAAQAAAMGLDASYLDGLTAALGRQLPQTPYQPYPFHQQLHPQQQQPQLDSILTLPASAAAAYGGAGAGGGGGGGGAVSHPNLLLGNLDLHDLTRTANVGVQDGLYQSGGQSHDATGGYGGGGYSRHYDPGAGGSWYPGQQQQQQQGYGRR